MVLFRRRMMSLLVNLLAASLNVGILLDKGMGSCTVLA